MPSWEAEVARARCWDCGEPIVDDEPTVPAEQPGWRSHADCGDACEMCGGSLEDGRWPGLEASLCSGCHDRAEAAEQPR